jgi:DNA-binding NarL/FixJ family response regulator
MLGTQSRQTAIIVDQAPLWLDTVDKVLDRAGIEVLARATSAGIAQDLLVEHEPDLLVTGIKMSGIEMDGIGLVSRAAGLVPGIRTVVLSMYEDHEHIDAAFEAGAAAYVFKTAHPDDLAAAIRQVFDHSIFLAGCRAVPQPAAPAMDESVGLTRRELEILTLVAEGHSNAQLARMLWVTEQTVKFHLSNIYRKLDVSNRTEASRWAQLRGLLVADQRQALAV